MKLNFLNGRIDTILVMGKSGAGKQPRIDVLAAEYRLKQFSTGDIFRDYLRIFDAIGYQGNIMDFYNSDTHTFLPENEIKQQLDSYLKNHQFQDVLLGLKAKYYVSNGFFVPDSVTNDLFLSSFAKNHYRNSILDGYPRTVDQSKFLVSIVKEKNRKIDAIIHIDNDDETILGRITGRRICPNCHKVFHIEYRPLREGKYCTGCGTKAIIRIDDTREKVSSRLKEYKEKTLPAIDFLISCNIPFISVPGNLPELSTEAVRNSVFSAIAKYQCTLRECAEHN